VTSLDPGHSASPLQDTTEGRTCSSMSECPRDKVLGVSKKLSAYFFRETCTFKKCVRTSSVPPISFNGHSCHLLWGVQSGKSTHSAQTLPNGVRSFFSSLTEIRNAQNTMRGLRLSKRCWWRLAPSGVRLWPSLSDVQKETLPGLSDREDQSLRPLTTSPATRHRTAGGLTNQPTNQLTN
jgi:hypothetical protein